MKRSFIIILLFCMSYLFAQTVNITDYYTFNYATQVYTEITGTSVPTAQGNDVMSGAIDIGFSFPYGANTYTQLKIASGGYITLGTNTGHTNVCDLASITYCPYIAAFWEALHTGRVTDGTYPLTSSVQFLRTGIAPNRTIKIQYKHAYYWYTSTNSTVNFQIVLNENGRIDFLYGSHTGTAPGGSPSYGVGINMLPGGAGNFYSLQQTFTSVSNIIANNTLTDYQPVNRKYSFVPRVPNNVGNVFPSSPQTGVSVNPVLDWANDTFGGIPTGYKVYLGTDNPPTNLINGTTTFNSSFTTPALAYQTHYYWKIVAFNAAGDAVNAPVWEFTTLNAIPGVITSPNPIHQATAVPINPALSWANSSTGGTPTGYRVYLGTDEPPTNLINGVVTTDTDFITPFLQSETQYFWKIVPFNDSGDAIGNATRSFTTKSGTPVFEITPGDHNFGRSVINYSIIQSYTMHNTGDLPLAVNSIELSDTTGFMIYSALWLPALIEPGDSLQFDLWFTPRIVDESYSTHLLISETSQPTVHSYLLQGTGTTPGPIITANINGAGTTNYGETIQTLPLLTIYNTGIVDLLFSTGPLTAPWISMNPSSGFVPTNDSLVIELIFDSNGMTPQSDPYEGLLSIITNDSVYPTFDLEMQMFVRNIDSFPFFIQFNESSFPPNGWTTQILSGAAGFTSTTAGLSPPCVSPSETRMICYEGSQANTGAEAYLASPPIVADDSLSMYSIEFYMYRYSGMPDAHDKIEVYSNNTQDLEGTPVLMGIINRLPNLAPVEPGGPGWYQYSFNFTPNPSGISYVIFKAICDNGSDLYLDDMIIWKQAIPPAVYSIFPGSYDLGRRPINHTKTLHYSIHNTGVLPLTVNSIGLSDTTCFALNNVPVLPIQLNSGDSINFNLTFSPRIVDESYSTNLIIDETSQPLHTYAINGYGAYEGPIITTNPASVCLFCETATILLQPMTINNTGIGDLIFSVGNPTSSWLSLNPASGVVPEGGSFAANIVINSHGLVPDNYIGTLTLNTNDTMFQEWGVGVGLEVLPGAVNADFNAVPLTGHAPLTVDFTDTSQYGQQMPGITTIAWNWDFQNDGIDDSFIQNPQNIVYSTPGMYSVKLTIISSNGMASTKLKTNYINVTNQPPVIANPINTLSMPEDTESSAINLTVLFTDPDGDALTYSVAGNTHFNTRYSSSSLYLTPKPLHWNGTETIHLTATDPFGAFVTQDVVVTVTPVNNPPDFNPPHQDAECNWALLSGTSFTLNFGDYITDPDTPSAAISIYAMNVSSTQHIILDYLPNTQGALTGTFTVSPGWTGVEHFQLMIRDTVTRETTQTSFDIKVISSLLAMPHANIVTGYTGQTIQFTDLTVGNPNSYIWNFGDGITSTAKNPVHTFNEPGNYPVMLTVANTQLTGSTNMSAPIQMTMVGIIAPTYNIAAPQHWQIAGAQNQYNVFQNLNIHNSGVLTIDPGVTVNVFDTTGVDVYGSINATSSTFHPIGEPTWGGLRFHNSEQVSHVNNCVIENAKMPISILNGNHEIDNVSINATGQMLEIDNSAIKITGNSSPILHNIGVMNYTTGIYINGSNSRETTTPILTNIRVRNSTNSSREDKVRTAIEISGNTSPVIDNVEIKNVDKGIVVENNSMLFTTTPSLHGIKIVNEPAESRLGEVGLSISGNVNAALDSLYVDYYKTGLSYSDFTDSSRDTPILTNIRVRNSTNSSRGTTVGVKLDKVSALQLSDCQIDSMSTGIKISNSDSGTTSTPILTNIRVRNSTNSSRFDNTGIDISGYVSPQFNDIWIDDYEQGINFTGTGTGLRNSTPILTNIRVRNSTNSSRTTSVGIVIKDVVNFTAANDTIEGYSLGLDISVSLARTTSTPILTNIRVRNSTNSSRLDATGVYLGNAVGGSMSNCLIEEYTTGILLADGNQTVLSYNLIKNCGYGIKASGISAPKPIAYNIFKLDTDWQNNNLWDYFPIYVQFTGPWEIYHNTLWGYPGALYASSATVTFMNNIVWDDSDITSLFSLNSSDIQYTYNDIRTTEEFEEGSGNFNAAPLMVDADNDDYNLTFDSPCIDTGNPASTPDADSTVTDIGVYAYLHKADFTPLTVNSILGTTINFINSSVGHDDPNTTVSWDLNNDGIIESISRDWSYQFNTPGLYDIKLIMTTGTLIDSLICEGAIAISDTLLKPPLNVEMQISGDDVLLDWDEVTETINGFPVSVQYYIIYKSDTANGVFEYLDYTEGTTEFTDIGATLSSEGFYFVIGFEGTFTQLQVYVSTHGSYPPERSGSVTGKIYKKKK